MGKLGIRKRMFDFLKFLEHLGNLENIGKHWKLGKYGNLTENRWHISTNKSRMEHIENDKLRTYRET